MKEAVERPYIIAELSGNHNGDLSKALKLIEAAANAGADAVKLQTYTADTMTIKSDLADFKISGGLWDGYTLYDLYHLASTPWEWHEALFEKAKECNIDCFSTPFDETAVDFLEQFNPPFYKIASFEMTDIPLLKKIASCKRPVIMSTGMANMEEIGESIECLKQNGVEDITILHCVSSYPATPESYNLATMNILNELFQVKVGLSDHTISNTTAILSVAFGARVIEKHFTLSRNEEGPDSAFSIEPSELNQLCRDTKIAFSAIGQKSDFSSRADSNSLKYRRSIYVVSDIKKGEVFTPNNIRRIRPGYGLAPKYYDMVLGKTCNENLKAGIALKKSHILGL